jgi:pyruvate/2-oxoglutarate dehydrogenase complex dihydrolipoamide dehydrogenase (E3) component
MLDIRQKMGKEGSGSWNRRAQKKAKAWYGTAWYKGRGKVKSKAVVRVKGKGVVKRKSSELALGSRLSVPGTKGSLRSLPNAKFPSF